ncbi:MAG: tripartite tricarboxylate transporter TctB family protein [Caulobacteraceae bacterium]
MKGQFFKKYYGLISGVIVALFAVAYLIGSLFIRRSKVVSIGAEFIPEIYGFVLLFLAVCLIYQGIRDAKLFTPENAGTEAKKDTKNVFLTFVLIIAYVAVMEFLGFTLSSILFLILMNILLTPVNTKRNYIAIAVYSVALSVGTYFLFHNLMYIPLPIGIIFGA